MPLQAISKVARETGIQLLTNLGLSITQAKLYLTLLEVQKAKAGTLAQNMGLPRSEIYRILNELQLKGLIDKEVCYPNKFSATPLESGLQVLLNHKADQCAELERGIKDFLEATSFSEKELCEEYEYKVTIIEGKQRIINIITQRTESAERSIKILTPLSRLVQIGHGCINATKAALARGVDYQIVLENPNGPLTLPKEQVGLLAKPNFRLATYDFPLKSNGAIFDGKEAIITFFPGKSVSESPCICTNHPSLISMLEDQFEKNWAVATEYRSKSRKQEFVQL
jgi:sugar-specific transcriptional regulator TrmB